MSDEFEVEFEFENNTNTIKANLQDKIKDLKNKALTNLGIKNDNLYSLYKGNAIVEDKKLDEIVDKVDKEEKKISILLCENIEGDEINTDLLYPNKGKKIEPKEIEIEFNFDGDVKTIKAKTDEEFIKIKDRAYKENSKIYFLYNGNIIDEKKKIEKIITEIDLGSKKMKILVLKKDDA